MTTPLRVLIVEDTPDDAELMALRLKEEGFQPDWQRVQTEPDYLAALEPPPDLILADWRLPHFSGLRALQLMRERGLDIPFVIVSGSIGEEAAIDALRQGAYDYVLKDRPIRLGQAVRHALEDKHLREERKRAEEALRESEQKYRAIVQNIPGMVYRANSDWKTEIVSGVESLCGYTADEINSIPRGWLNIIHPDDRDAVEREGVLLIRERRVVVQPYRIIAKNGQTRWIEDHKASAFSESGIFDGVDGIVMDINERKQRERELEAIATVSAALRTAKTRAEMMPVILDQLLALLQSGGAALAMRDPVSDETLIELARGEWATWTGIRLPPSEGVGGHVIATGQPYVTDDIESDPRMSHRDLIGGLRAIACIPLVAQEQTIGALWVGQKTKIADNEVRLLAAISDTAANAIYRATLYEQTQHRLVQVQGLNAIDKAIMGTVDTLTTLNILLLHLMEQLQVDAADILLFDPLTKTLEYAAGRGFISSIIEDSRIHLGEGMAGRVALERQMLHVAPLLKAGHELARSRLMLKEGFVSYYGVPLIAQGNVMGVLEIFYRAAFEGDPEWMRLLDTLAAQATIAINTAELFRNLKQSNTELELAYDSTIEGWSRALDLRDKETEGHTQRVTEIAVLLARQMGIPEAELVHVQRGALLHDIGKMGVPDLILLKPGPLTDAEWVIMRQHPTIAFELLLPIVYLRPALDIPYGHHEKWDGTGYPRGLKGEQIPLPARIFAVVDVWDALRSARPYRVAWPEDKVLENLKEQSGKHFDPKVVEAFLNLLDILFPKGESGAGRRSRTSGYVSRVFKS